MRTPKEVIGLAWRSGAKRLEIAFVDAVGVSRQFTCPVTQLAERFDNSAEALTSSFRATTAGLDLEASSPRFTWRRSSPDRGFPSIEGDDVGIPSTSEGQEGASNSILVIEQDAVFREFIRRELEKRGFDVLDAATGQEGIEALRHCHAGAVLVDMDVPDAAGATLIKQLQGLSRAPVVALAGQVNDIGAAETLDVGASDFITRPVNFDELSARVRASQRRALPSSSQIFRSGSLTVDLTRRLVSVAGESVKLSVTEYSLLELLVRNAGLVVSYAQMLREVWGEEMSEKVNYLRVYFVALRKKLEIPSEPGLFLTERSVGYRLVVR